MHPSLRNFVRQYLAVVCAALVPVILTAFISMPMILGSNMHQAHSAEVAVERHLT